MLAIDERNRDQQGTPRLQDAAGLHQQAVAVGNVLEDLSAKQHVEFLVGHRPRLARLMTASTLGPTATAIPT